MKPLQKIRDYAQLVKLKLSILVLSSALIGFWLASGQSFDKETFAMLALGLFLIIAGANAANEIIEMEPDSLMRRTTVRPLPSYRMTRKEAFLATSIMSVAGFSILISHLGMLVFLLGLLAFGTYVWVYTPLKKISPICVLVGAIPGALPAMIGPAAASHAITPLAWLMFGIVFLWQFPHFAAIAWVAKDDYQKAGFKVLAYPQDVRFTAYQILLFSCALLGISPLLILLKQVGSYYLVGSFLMGLFLLYYALAFWFKPTHLLARRVMGAAILYLPSLFLLMILDQVPVSW